MREDTHSESGEYGLCDGMSNVMERELELANS
jgi:hypothetical protein